MSLTFTEFKLEVQHTLGTGFRYKEWPRQFYAKKGKTDDLVEIYYQCIRRDDGSVFCGWRIDHTSRSVYWGGEGKTLAEAAAKMAVSVDKSLRRLVSVRETITPLEEVDQ